MSLREIGIPPEPEEEALEPHETFAENALSKARHFHRRSGLPTLADDSGLCVDALEGGPGVRAKRFAPAEKVERWGRDEANNRFLLEKLAGLPRDRRRAHYRCAVAAVGGPGGPLVVEGAVHGRIAGSPRGTGGFGYDPLFIPREERKTYAELPPEAKLATSHRAEAFRQVRPWLERLKREGS